MEAVTTVSISEKTPLMTKKKHQTQNSHIFGIFLPVSMLVIGILVLNYVEGWPILTCLYVLTQIVTTIGYGDFTVQHPGSKLFMAIYVLCALVVLAYYLNVLVAKLLDRQSDAIRHYLRAVEGSMDDTEEDHATASYRNKQIKKYGAVNKLIAAVAAFVFALLFGVVFFRLHEHCTCSYDLQSSKGCDDTKGFETCVATNGYVKEWVDAFYMSSVTLTTIGFGDLQPRSFKGRAIGIIWMLLGVGATANLVAAMTTYFFEADAGKGIAENVAEISQDEFDQIDVDGSGDFSRGDFLAFMLVKHMGVSADVVDGVLAEFSRLDKSNTNKVTYDMLLARQQTMRRSSA